MILLIVLFFAPAQNVNKPLSQEVYIANKSYSVCFCFGITVTIMLLMDKHLQIAMLLLINYVEIVVSMILGKGVYWYVKGKEEKDCSWMWFTCNSNICDWIHMYARWLGLANL